MNTLRLSANYPDVEVLHNDGDLIAVNKPAGLFSVPDRFNKAEDNLYDLLTAAMPGQITGHVHQLDRNTSGVFICAKNAESYRNLSAQFRERQVKEIYAALVQGIPASDPLVIDLPIGVSPKHAGYLRIDLKSGKEARTTVRVEERFRGYAFVKAEITTGRLHQIHVHLQATGNALVGDTDYGGAPLLLSHIKRKYKPKPDEEERPLMARPALHAESITLANPPLTIAAPWPKDLTLALKYLRKCAS